MSNCISGYYYKMKNNIENSLIIISYDKEKKQKLAIELNYIYDKEKIKNINVIQAYQKYNNPLTEEQKNILKNYLESITKSYKL